MSTEFSNKQEKIVKSLQFSNPGAKFNFNAETTGKRKIKSTSRFDHNINVPLYNEKGVFIQTNQDLCDCLRFDCTGCHFACPQCKSSKCGNKCRVNRQWYYEKIEIEGIANSSLEFNPQ